MIDTGFKIYILMLGITAVIIFAVLAIQTH